MKIRRIGRYWIAATLSLAILVGVVALICNSSGQVEIRGNLPPKDVAEIKRLHQSILWSSWYPSWLPNAIGRQISAKLNPIDVIAAPSEGKVIVVYRGFDCYFYDSKGKHRWGHASYTLVKGRKSWEEKSVWP